MSVEINDLENTEIDTTYIDDIKSSRIEDFYIDSIVNIPLIKGEKGDKGDKGDKPVVGVDYYTEAEKTEFKNAVIQDSKTDIDEYTSSKKNEYNDNATEKIQEYNSNAISKTETFNTNAQNKIDEYNTNAESLINKIAGVESKNTEQDTNIANKVDKEAGKGLSSNDYTDAEKEKLASLSNYNDTEIKADITDIKSTDTEQDKKIAELEKENIKLRNQIPSGTASGNAIHIEDSSDLELMWKLKGGHKQETRSVRNLYDIKNIGDRTIPPEISIDDDDWITVTADNSSGTSDKYVNYFTKNLNLKPNTQYSLIAEFKKCTGDDSVSLSLVNNGNNEGQFNINHSLKISSIKENNTKKSKFIITTKADLSNTKNGLRTYLYMPAGTSVIITFRISVIEDTSVGLDNFKYEKYGVSPSPDYSSEIETVGDNFNLLDIDKTTYDITTNLKKEGEYLKGNNVNNVRIGVLSNSTPKIEEQLQSGSYTISYEVEANANVRILNLFLCVIYEDDTQENIKSVKSYVLEKGTKKKAFWTLNVQKNTKKIGIVSYLSVSCDVLLSKVKVEKGEIATPYSPYGMGSVKIDVVNSNLLGFNAIQEGNVKVNEDGTITINGKGGFSLKVRKFIAKANTKYYLRWELISGTVSGVNIFMNPILKKGWINKDTFVESSVTEDSEISDIWINEGAVFSNAKIKIWISKSQNDFTKHQSQTAIMPIQQEMLTGDYISSVEHHEWGKIESYNGETITTDYISTTGELTTGATVYYKLATPLDLELTTEQKVIREQKLHTYKNVTNISLSNDLAIVDVSYKKDVETITKNCVQKEDGKELSSNDYTDAEKEKLASLSNYNDTEIKADITGIKSKNTEQDTNIANKVDKEAGKGLSSNDYTDAEKEKLTNIEENAEVNIIESIKKNGVALEVEDKAVDIVVPTKTSELINDSGFLANTYSNNFLGRLYSLEDKVQLLSAFIYLAGSESQKNYTVVTEGILTEIELDEICYKNDITTNPVFNKDVPGLVRYNSILEISGAVKFYTTPKVNCNINVGVFKKESDSETPTEIFSVDILKSSIDSKVSACIPNIHCVVGAGDIIFLAFKCDETGDYTIIQDEKSSFLKIKKVAYIEQRPV